MINRRRDRVEEMRMLRGVEVTVYEQAPRISEFGARVVMTPNAMKALRSLGVEGAVLAQAFGQAPRPLGAHRP